MKSHPFTRLLATVIFTVSGLTFCNAQSGVSVPGNTANYGYHFRSSTKDNAGNVWFGTSGNGIYRYNTETGKFTNFNQNDTIASNYVNDVYADKAGDIWLATSNGVSRYNGSTFINYTTNDGLCYNDISCVLEDKDGIIWFGTSGKGVCRYNPKAKKSYTNFSVREGLTNIYVQCLYQDKGGQLWVGTRGGGVFRYNPVADSLETAQRASGKSFTAFSTNDCADTQIMNIMEDKKGNIWFCNLYGGACRYNPKSGETKRFNVNNGLCSNVVTCILEDKQGNLWFGSDLTKGTQEGGGVCRYDGKSYTHYSTKDGLGSMGVYTMIEDKQGRIWVGSKNGGLSYFDGKTFVNMTGKADQK